MSQRTVATLCLVVVAVAYSALICSLPVQKAEGLLPTLTPTHALTILPTATGVLEAELRPTKTPQPPIVLDLLPMATATPRPSVTPTPVPTRTPRPELPPVQRG